MSHFYLGAVVPLTVVAKGEEEVKHHLDKLMAPYSDELEVEPYETECYCVGEDGAANPSCERCNGSGMMMTTCNPQGKWEWWVIGGRYAGRVAEVEFPDDGEGGFNFAPIYKMLKGNCLRVDAVLEKLAADDDYGFFALLTPDGKWHERGQMWMWGVVIDEKLAKDWHAEQITVLQALDDNEHTGLEYVVVGLDCHQ